METPISVKLLQTANGIKFVTVFPPVQPHVEEKTWRQQVRSPHIPFRNSNNYFGSIGEYIQSQYDQAQ